MTGLPNPELLWQRDQAPRPASLDKVESRIGKIDELLSGGLANTNLRVGDDIVLRIFRNDPARGRQRGYPPEASLAELSSSASPGVWQ